MDAIYELTLLEISSLSIDLKKQIINQCLNELEKYKKYNRILEQINEYKWYINGLKRILKNELPDYNLSLLKVIYAIENELFNYTSYDLFPNHHIILYPSIKELKSTKIITCNICGGIIKPNSYYLSYRPLLEDLTNNNRYILKNTIKCETSYYDILPQTISQFEDFDRKLHDEYYDISTNIKSEHLYLLKLKKRN